MAAVRVRGGEGRSCWAAAADLSGWRPPVPAPPGLRVRRRVGPGMAQTRRVGGAAVVACVLLTACAGPETGPGLGGADVPWSARAIGQQIDTDFNTAGLPRLRDGVERCYASTTSAVPVMRQALRGCLVHDYTARRIDSRVLGPAVGHSPYWARQTINERWARYAVLAGFATGDEALEYMRRGSDAVVADFTRSRLPISWQAGFAPRPVERIRPGTF